MFTETINTSIHINYGHYDIMEECIMAEANVTKYARWKKNRS